MPLMRGIGAARFVNDITTSELAAATHSLLSYAAKHGCVTAAAALRKQEGELLSAMQQGEVVRVKGVNNVVVWNGNGHNHRTAGDGVKVGVLGANEES
jgi:hypothetical protein